MDDGFHDKVKVGDTKAKGRGGFLGRELEKCWLQIKCDNITFADRHLRLLIVLIHR
jgi:hypothetical protein